MASASLRTQDASSQNTFRTPLLLLIPVVVLVVVTIGDYWRLFVFQSAANSQ